MGVERHGPESTLGHIDVLFLCTGNICRSPMAQALLAHRLEARGVPALVHSAGTFADGRSATEHSVSVLADRGVVLEDHTSRVINQDMLHAADLILGMTRQHVREAVVLLPSAWTKSFTLKELVRLGKEAGPRSPQLSLEDWLDKVGAGRSRADLLGNDHRDDIADPYGAVRARYEVTAREIETLVDQLVDLAFPAGVHA